VTISKKIDYKIFFNKENTSGVLLIIKIIQLTSWTKHGTLLHAINSSTFIEHNCQTLRDKIKHHTIEDQKSQLLGHVQWGDVSLPLEVARMIFA
jgi:hypothetical protein